MPGRVTELSETQIVADLLADRRRQGAAVAAVQIPQPAKDAFTVAATPATTYRLTAIPYQGTGGSSLNFSLNGVELVEGVDYTVDYTTGVVTVSATLKGTPTPADVLTADYWTTGDLIALSSPVDTGAISDDFNRADNSSSLGVTSVGGAVWTPIAQGTSPVATWGVSVNQAYASALGAGQALVVVDAGVSDGTFQFTLATFNNTLNAGGLFRVQDGSNYWAVFAQTGLQRNNSGTFTLASAFTFTQADVMTVVLAGSSITVKKNGTTVATATDGSFPTATKFGLYTENTAHRFDDFSVTP